jgi:hypothetical protein
MICCFHFCHVLLLTIFFLGISHGSYGGPHEGSAWHASPEQGVRKLRLASVQTNKALVEQTIIESSAFKIFQDLSSASG